MKEQLDVFFNSVLVGTLEVDENVEAQKVAKSAEVHFPRRTVVIKKYIFLPHKSISFFEKIT